MHSVCKTGWIVFLFPSAGLLLVWEKEQSCQILHLLSFLTSASVPSLPIPFLSLSVGNGENTPWPRSYTYPHHTFQGSFTTPLILGVHNNLGPGKRHSPYCPGVNLQICCSVPLWLLPQGAAEAQGRCVSHWVHGCCCKGGYERQTLWNSRGYCSPPQGSMNGASRRQLIHAVLWSMQ